MDPDAVHCLRYAAPLHDIGKIALPDSILRKPEALSLDEWDVLKTHTTIGAQMFAGSRSPILQMAEEIALYHHENWDGTGYTPGLGGDDIPLVGRIVAVADVFDALTHERPYKAAWSVEETVDWMESMRGAKFDPKVLDALFAVLATQDLATLDPEDEALGYTTI
jgi:putative two-component system response regulator